MREIFYSPYYVFYVTIVMLIIVKKINSYGLVEIAYYWRRMGRFFQ